MSKWSWCLVNDDKTLAKNWIQVGDYWYFLDSNGAMVTGWYEDSNGKWYYLNDVTDDKFPQGAMVTGWKQVNNKWYYLYELDNASQGEYIGTTAYSCTKTLSDGKEYTFDENGVWIENSSLVSNKIVDVIKYYEGFSATPYQDEVGVWTLGYGMTGEEIEGIVNVTEDQATAMLKDWINRKYAPVIKADLDSKGVALNQNEFDALVSMAYNVGTGGVLGSTLYKNIVAGVRNVDTITSNFQSWSKAGGNTLLGLYRRRTTEANIFLTGDYTIVTD